jgi:hypothetical protein
MRGAQVGGKLSKKLLHVSWQHWSDGLRMTKRAYKYAGPIKLKTT